MEFKLLFYALAIIAWLLFKFYEKRKEELKRTVHSVEPPLPPPIEPQIRQVPQKPIKNPLVDKVSKQIEIKKARMLSRCFLS